MSIESGSTGKDNSVLVQTDDLIGGLSGHSAKLYEIAKSQVGVVATSGLPVFPPRLDSVNTGDKTFHFAVIVENRDELGLTGPVSVAEAVALEVGQLVAMGLEIAQEDLTDYQRVKKLMNLEAGEILPVAAEGFTDFLFDIGTLAGYRQGILAADRGELQSPLNENDATVKAMRSDGMMLGRNTVDVLIREIGERKIRGKNSEALISTKLKGAQRAAAIYLDTLAIASGELPTTLERFTPKS